jgi:predicted dehydrogenase
VILEYAPQTEPGRIIVAAQSKTPASNGIGLGVIGAGNFAKGVLLSRLRNHSKVKLLGVTTASGMSAKAAAEKFGFAYCTNNIVEILADNSVNAVLVATRHNTHADFVIKAIKAGKHVFVEKPLCLNEKELDEN